MSGRNKRSDGPVDHKSMMSRTDADYVVCICPSCRKEHKELMFWTGNGMPRTYCKRCRRVMADYIRYDGPEWSTHSIRESMRLSI